MLCRGRAGIGCSHAHTEPAEKVLEGWLAKHPGLRLATDTDCKCDEDIEQMRRGYGGNWGPVRDYHPYVATGDFNGDGAIDFAVMVIDRFKSTKNFALLVFSGPLRSKSTQPAFIQADQEGDALFFGPPRPKPYRLVVGPFESDNSAILVPRGRTYVLEENGDE